jgi:hypothetical protein
MISQWISNLTPKQIIIFLVLIAAAIYVVWYVIEALEGIEPNYVPGGAAGTNTSDTSAEIKGKIEVFDPTKKTPEAIPAK